MKKKEVLKFLLGPLFVTIVFFLINLVFVCCHEQWYDESVPWTMAQKLNFSNFYEVMSVEPHPPLWYLMLMPLAKLGFPYISMNILSLTIVSLAVYLFIKKSPFNKPVTLLLLLTSMFFYYNGVIARDYCLTVLGLVAVACLYKDRLKHPIKYCLAIVLLSQSHILLGALAACLAIAFFVEMIKNNKKEQKENRSKIPAWKVILYIVLLFGSLASMMPQVIGVLANHGIVTSSFESLNISNIFIALDAYAEMSIGIVGPMAFMTILIPLIYLYGKSLKVFFFYLIEVIYYFVILGYVYVAADALPQKVAIITSVTIFSIWIVQYEKHRKKNRISNLCKKSALYTLVTKYIPAGTLCVMCTFVTIPQTVSAAIQDINDVYSQSRQVADWINENIEDGAVLIVSGLNDEMGVSPAVPMIKNSITVYSAMYQKEFEYSTYLDKIEEYLVSDEDFLAQVETLSKDQQVYYFRIVGSCGSSTLTYEPADDWRTLRLFYGGYGGYATEPIVKIYKVPANYKVEVKE